MARPICEHCGWRHTADDQVRCDATRAVEAQQEQVAKDGPGEDTQAAIRRSMEVRS